MILFIKVDWTKACFTRILHRAAVAAAVCGGTPGKTGEQAAGGHDAETLFGTEKVIDERLEVIGEHVGLGGYTLTKRSFGAIGAAALLRLWLCRSYISSTQGSPWLVDSAALAGLEELVAAELSAVGGDTRRRNSRSSASTESLGPTKDDAKR